MYIHQIAILTTKQHSHFTGHYGQNCNKHHNDKTIFQQPDFKIFQRISSLLLMSSQNLFFVEAILIQPLLYSNTQFQRFVLHKS